MNWEKARPWLAEYRLRLPPDAASDSATWFALREFVHPNPPMELRNAIDIREALRTTERTLTNP